MLSLVAVRKAFGSLVAVDGVSLDIRRGEVFGLLGPNGAGKTTTVNMAVGLLGPDSGTVAVNLGGNGQSASAGQCWGSPTDARVRSLIGVAPQSLAIYEELSGRENLAFFGQLHGLAGGKLKERVDWALDFVGLTDRAKDLARKYSGGMKRRLNMAVALMNDPPLLLFDEPTVGVDPQSRNAIFERIEALRAEGRTVVYTTHYMEEADRLCDRVAIMDHGKLLALDTMAELVRAHGGKSMVIASRGEGEERIQTDDPMAELGRLQELGRLTSFRVEQPNLEAVFLNLTGRRLRD